MLIRIDIRRDAMLRVPWYRGFEFLLQREGYGDKVIVEGVKATMMLGIL